MISLPQTKAWQDLQAYAADAKNLHIAKLLDSETDRLDRMMLTLEGAVFDFSKHLVSKQTMELLFVLARQQDVEGWFKRMFAGEAVNQTENRPAWHTQLRAKQPPNEVERTLARMRKLSDLIRADQKIRHVVHIGIGGSDLGPRLVYDALKGSHEGPQVHFVSNVDPDDLDAILKYLKPEETILSVASKTFTTQETMLNFHAAKQWLGNRPDRMIALTSNPSAARAEGFSDNHILPMWDWVGGRFSVWSSVGFPIAAGCGFDVFEKFLQGGLAADDHVAKTPLQTNIPILMALLSVWYRNFLNVGAHAILPYAQALYHLPNYMQQLTMESNGKRVDRQGNVCAYATAPVVFGQVGTNGQHAFYQMLHQGADFIPCDFIGMRESNGDSQRHHVLLVHMLAQSRALMLGRGGEPARVCPGNRPSTCIIMPRLDAYNLGLLLALYEHKTAAEGFLWNINSFDQFGVELGKELAKELLAPQKVLKQNETLDKSTSKLIFHTFRAE